MSGCLSLLLAVLWLTDPDEFLVRPSPPAAAVGGETAAHPGEAVKSAHITSRASDFDRAAGVVMFEGDVCVRYSEDFVMCADRLYMFLSKSNELSRVVAVGGVSITNEQRVGSCAMATYRRAKGEIEMFGDGKATLARLAESGEVNNSLEGVRIKFRLGSEQVEVESPRLSSDRQRGGEKLL